MPSVAKNKKPAGFPAGFCVIQTIAGVVRLRADSCRAVRGTVMVEMMHVVDGPTLTVRSVIDQAPASANRRLRLSVAGSGAIARGRPGRQR